MKKTLIALMFVGAIFAQNNKEVMAFVMHDTEGGMFDENSIMIPANAKMNKLGKTPSSLPYATSLKKLYEDGWEIEEIFSDSSGKGSLLGAAGSSKSRTIFIMKK
jgi:hypothetical protein|tara:strand:- start:61 stop:375 length:315 start_codon:yes stop_codon:yes gene_type:complete